MCVKFKLYLNIYECILCLKKLDGLVVGVLCFLVKGHGFETPHKHDVNFIFAQRQVHIFINFNLDVKISVKNLIKINLSWRLDIRQSLS